MKPKSHFLAHRQNLLVAFTFVVSTIPQAHSADGNWTNTSGGLWNSTGNWAGGTVANGANSTADFSILEVSGGTTVSLDSPRTVGNITFGNTGFDYSNWILDDGGNAANILTLAVSSGSPTITVSNTTRATISASIAGTSGLTKVGYGGDLTLSGNNIYTGTTTIQAGRMLLEGSGTLGSGNNLTIAADTPFVGTGGSLWLGGTTQQVGNVEINGTGDKIDEGNLVGTHYSIINSGVDGAGNQGQSSTISAGLGGASTNLNKSGHGLTVLSGLNTYGGSTNIGQGALQFANTASLYGGDDSKWLKENIIVNDTATFAINVGGSGEFNTQQAKDLLINLSTGITNNGLMAGAAFAIDTTNAVADTTFDQTITDSTGTGAGPLSFTKLGAGNLILDQVNTHTGTTTINGGTLTLSGVGTLGSFAALAVNNSGELNLGGTTQHVGDLTMSGGTISNGSLLASSYTIQSGSISAALGGSGVGLTVNGGLTLSGANTYTGTTVIDMGYIQISGGGTLGSNSNLMMTDGSLDLGGTTQTVGTVQFNSTNGFSEISNGTLIGSSFAISNTNNSFSSDTISAGLAGVGANLEKSGSGRVVLSGTNSYTGTTTISEGTLRFNTTASLYSGDQSQWTKANLSAEAGGTLELNLGGASGFSIAQAKSLLTDLTSSINNNGLQVGSTFSMRLGIGTGNQTFDQVIADSTGVGGGSIGLMNRGFDTLTLNQANTYTGTTTVGGSLAISGAGTLGNHADLVVGDTNFFFADLNLGGTTQTVGAVTINDGHVHNGNLIGDSYTVQSGTISSGLGGVGTSFTKTSAADTTAYLSGTNTYTGTTTVAGGELIIGKTASLYNSDATKWTKANISVAGGATLGVNVGGAGEFTSAQAGNMLTSLTSSINNNGLQAGSTFAITTSSAVADTTFNTVIADSTGTGGGALGFSLRGDSSTLTLTQANTYTGPTTVHGRLALSGAGTLGNHANLIVGHEYSTAANLNLGGTTQTVGAVTINNGQIHNGNLIGDSYIVQSGTISSGLGGAGASFTKTGDAGQTANLSGTNTYTGTTTVNGGELQIVKTASLYNSDATKWTKANISVAGGATLALNLGGAGEFTPALAGTLLTNLTTSISNNGLQNGSTFAINTHNAIADTTFGQEIRNSTGLGGGGLSFTKAGEGKLLLTAANSYSYGTQVRGGALLINNTSGSGAGTGYVAIHDSATLGGTGSFTGNVIVHSGGTLAPGASIETLRSGSLTFEDGSTFAYETNSSAALAVAGDLQIVDGHLTLNGTVNLDLIDLSAAFADGTVLSLINYTAFWNGGLFSVDGQEIADGETFTSGLNTWMLDYDAETGGMNFTGEYAGESDRFVNLTHIPEPSAALLCGIGCLALLRRHRRDSGKSC